MAKSKYEELEVLAKLKRRGVSINKYKKTISYRTAGIGTLGLIDYLVNYCRYSRVY